MTAAAISTRNLIGAPDAALQEMDRWLGRAAEQGAELALFPELNVSGYIPSEAARTIAETIPGPSTDKAVRLAARHRMTFAFGLIERAGERLHCSHVLVNGDGVLGWQRKIHVPAQEQSAWSAGDAIEVIDMGKARIGIAICRDAFFDEMTRTLYFKGAEIVLMPFGYYNVPRSRYMQETIHGKSLVKSAWTNGYFELVCNSAGERPAGPFDARERRFPGWAGIIDPWGKVLGFADEEGNAESMVVRPLDPADLLGRRSHSNFLARELRPELYRFS
jgi:predicted amidohydrolase